MRNVNRKKEGVSPVIAVILMVAITVVLAAVLYVMVINILPDDPEGITVVAASKSQITNGWRINIDNGKFDVASDTDAYVEDNSASRAVGGRITTAGITNDTYPAGPEWVVVWNDNNGDGSMNAGDTLFIRDVDHTYAGYRFKLVKGSSSPIDIEL